MPLLTASLRRFDGTTAVGVPADCLETRFTTGVFSFGNGDQLILEGTGQYPSAGSALEVSASTVRVVVGAPASMPVPAGHRWHAPRLSGRGRDPGSDDSVTHPFGG